ncbi:copper chaperone PCu(A)C [Rhodococcus sp. NPDC127528]|uniref:copper chaperone PCu(A)C n=1 Tax=unclassified Rhodococcus (in: high G+C Gram-positive bacteria) TaxID=192944 RepID=UPI003634032D
MIETTRFRLASACLAAATALALAGCSSGGDDTPQAQAITFTDSWVKAADSGMTAAFGTLANGSGSDATLTEVSSPVSPRVELHEMASDGSGAMKMRQKDGGFTIPAKGSHTLAPGADHIMFFELPDPVRAGADVPLTMRFSDGSTVEFTAQVRDFAGAKEEYSESHGG